MDRATFSRCKTPNANLLEITELCLPQSADRVMPATDKRPRRSCTQHSECSTTIPLPSTRGRQAICRSGAALIPRLSFDRTIPWALNPVTFIAGIRTNPR